MKSQKTGLSDTEKEVAITAPGGAWEAFVLCRIRNKNKKLFPSSLNELKTHSKGCGFCRRKTREYQESIRRSRDEN